ncbi:MAG: hypothetical protein AMJ93_09615 [Anaerolineae bacterium SM23_84]|nr:MAG: hypothetical protein AMJ93_09615 [Anaerolineae bacterium SM23_84]
MEIGFRLVVPGQLGQRLYDELDESSAIDQVPSTSATASQLGLTEPAAAVRVVADVSNLDGLAAKVYAIADRWRKESGRQFVPLLVQGGHADALVKVHDSANRAAVVKQVVEVIQK